MFLRRRWENRARRSWHLLLLGAGLALIAIVFVLCWRPTIEMRLDPGRIVATGGYEYSINLAIHIPPGYVLLGDNPPAPKQSNLVVLRDGVPIGPPYSLDVTIRDVGNGAFIILVENTLLFSTPGNSDPRTDGRSYSARAQLALDARLAVALAAAGLLLAALLAVLAIRPAAAIWPRVALPLKLGALAIFLLSAPWGWVPLLWRQADFLLASGRWGVSALYAAVFITCLIGLCVAPFLRGWRLRVPVVALICFGFAADQIMLAIAQEPLTIDMVDTLWRERAGIEAAVLSYGEAIFTIASIAVLLGLVLALPPPGRWALAPRFAIAPIGALVGVAALMVATNGRIETFPPSYSAAVMWALTQIPSDHAKVARAPVEYSLPTEPLARKIIMVVDESVRGDYLGLNTAHYDNVPALRAASHSLANYGVAISGTNCSAGARLMLRIGLQKAQLPDTIGLSSRLPTLWRYAHRAGFKTALVDAWWSDRAFHSYMEEAESKEIDLKLHPDDERLYMRDMQAADRIIDLLRRDEPMLIYVNKRGAHQPYGATFPPDIDYDPSPLVARLPLDDTRRGIVRDYHKALRWSVDGFFERVMPEIARSNAVLIYTSDHGQSMFEGGYDLSHCSGRPNRGEVSVPLFVLAGSSDLLGMFRAEAQRAFNRASHFEVFPTLLELMGYSKTVGREGLWSQFDQYPGRPKARLPGRPDIQERGALDRSRLGWHSPRRYDGLPDLASSLPRPRHPRNRRRPAHACIPYNFCCAFGSCLRLPLRYAHSKDSCRERSWLFLG